MREQEKKLLENLLAEGFEIVKNRSEVLLPAPEGRTTMCPGGCGHDLTDTILARVIEDKVKKYDDLTERGFELFFPVGCEVFGYYWFAHKEGVGADREHGIDSNECAHGRATSEATGYKLAMPEKIVITRQGDGDFAGIGLADSLHTFRKGVNLLVIYSNNAYYSMTGAQSAPTTPKGVVTKTEPLGSSENPIRMAEHAALLDGTVFSVRVAPIDRSSYKELKHWMSEAIDWQYKNRENPYAGTCLIEVLSPCPVFQRNKETPTCEDFIREKMLPIYETGVFKNKIGD